MPNYLSIWISMGSLIVTSIAAIIAFRSSNIAKRSLKIVEAQAKGRSPLLVPYLMKSSFIMAEETSKRIYAFWISLTNRSDLDNSVVNIQLQLNYYRPGQPCASIVLPHNMKLRTYLGKEVHDVLPNPIKTPAHDTVAGLILFECSSEVLEKIIVDSYEISFIDSNGLKCSLNPILLTEMVNAKD